MTHRVFVYGSLKRGFANDSYLTTARFIRAGKTAPVFTMVSFGGFPGVFRGGSTAIEGEVFDVDDATLERLDRLEGHPRFYRRQPIEVDGERMLGYLLPRSAKQQRDLPTVDSGVWEESDWRMSS